ncbi:MAG: hypothetical protein GY765_41000 [bacterium]|nr:hypothetical protein [bacterium]
MKVKKLTAKLNLNRITVADLSGKDIETARGGWMPTYNNELTCAKYCVTTPDMPRTCGMCAGPLPDDPVAVS